MMLIVEAQYLRVTMPTYQGLLFLLYLMYQQST